MGAVESCCGKRRPDDMPSMPTKPVSALGNQYVTFNPEQPELFIMKQGIWNSHQAFDVRDIAQNDWFKIEGKDAQVEFASASSLPLSMLVDSVCDMRGACLRGGPASAGRACLLRSPDRACSAALQWTGQKRLVLNTGVPHCYVERKSLSTWHIYVAHERRATVRREWEKEGKHVYYIMLHMEPYPSRTSEDSAGISEPRLMVTGNFKACNYWFQECQSREQRRIARVDRNSPDGGVHSKDAYLVQVAASVDVAVIILVTMIIDACEQDDQDNENHTGRDSTVDSSRTGDDRWRHSLDPVPIQIAGARPDVGVNKGVTVEGSKVPPLWPKGKGKTPRGAGF